MASRENLTLELKIICATDVSHTNATNKMDVYAVVSINGDNNSQTQPAKKTPIDHDGGSNPTWNHPVKFHVTEREAREGLVTVNVKLYNYWLEEVVDLEIGEVNVSVQELLALNPLPSLTNGNGDKMKLMSLPVKVIGGSKAKLSLSYRFKPALAGGNMYPSFSENSSSFRCLNVDSEKSVNPPQIQTPMKKLTLDLVIKMTKGVKDNSWIRGMDMYASVKVCEGARIMHRSNTPITFGVHKDPIWDHAIKFTLDEPLARDGRLNLFVQLINHRTIRGDKEMGEVKVPIRELLGLNPPSTLTNDMKLITRDVSHVRDKSRKIGTLSFMYKFLNEEATFPPAPSQPTIPPAPSQPTTPPAPPTAIPQQLFVFYAATVVTADNVQNQQ